MGMDCSAYISYGVWIDYDGEVDLPFDDDTNMEDWYVQKHSGVENLYNLSFDERQSLRASYPCPYEVSYDGFGEYLNPIIHLHGTQISSYCGPAEIDPSKLDVPKDDHDKFVKFLTEELGITDEPGWLLYSYYG